jgi:hypothetical protein
VLSEKWRSGVDTPDCDRQNRLVPAPVEPVMATLITDPLFEASLLEQRQAAGADHHDQVGEGVNWMAPQPNNEHRRISFKLASVLAAMIDDCALGETFVGVNITDRSTGWTHNSVARTSPFF